MLLSEPASRIPDTQEQPQRVINMKDSLSGDIELLQSVSTAIFNSVSDGILIINTLEQKVVTCNQVAASVFGGEMTAGSAVPETLRPLLGRECPIETYAVLTCQSGQQPAQVRIRIEPLGPGYSNFRLLLVTPGGQSATEEAPSPALSQAIASLRRVQETLAASNSSSQSSTAGADLEQEMSRLRHDLRNYLNVIGGYAQVLMARVKDKRQKEQADMIYQACNEAHELISNRLRFNALPPRGESYTSPALVELKNVVSEVVNQLNGLMQDKQ